MRTPEEIARDCIALIPLTTADARKVEAAISLAITQDRAETIEACARVADGNDFFQVARQIAAAIRSLSPSREETGGNHD